MRNKLLFLIFFLHLYFSNAQATHDFMGVIKLNDSSLISYRISLKEENGKVTGQSITNIGGDYESLALIKGVYDKDKKELSFQETETIYTKTPLDEDYEFCYINATIKGLVLGKSKSIKSNFTGLYSDKVRCAKGELILTSVSKIEERLERVEKKINKSKRIPDSIKQKIQPLKLMDTLNMNILKKNQTLSVFTKSKQIKMTIFDGGKEDGDKITITSNGKTILNNFAATNNKKTLTIDLLASKTTLAIKANNEGSISPNTVVIEINDGENNLKALSNLKLNETTRVDILKKPK